MSTISCYKKSLGHLLYRRCPKGCFFVFWRCHPEFRSATGTPNDTNRIPHALRAERGGFDDDCKTKKTPCGHLFCFGGATRTSTGRLSESPIPP